MSPETIGYIRSFALVALGIAALLIALKCITSGLAILNKKSLAKMNERRRARNKRLWSITADQMRQFKISKSVIDVIRTNSDLESRVKELKRLKMPKLEALIKKSCDLSGTALQTQTKQVYAFLHWYKPQRLAALTFRDRVIDSWYGDVVSGLLFVVFISQSSSVLNAITIAGVSSGNMSERKAATMGSGGEIGTTLTAHLAAFSLAIAKLPLKYFAALIPIALICSWTSRIFRKIKKKEVALEESPITQRRRKVQQSKTPAFFEKFKDRSFLTGLCKAVGGFGLIFLALEIIGTAFNTPEVKNLLQQLLGGFTNPWALLLMSTIATGIISSSSMVTAITVTMALNGIITVDQAFAIISGANVGTCFTTNLAAIGQPKAAKRAAMMTLYLNLIPAIVITTLLSFKNSQQLIISGLSLLSSDAARQTAWFHTFFNLSVVLMFPFLDSMLALQKKINPDEGQGVFEQFGEKIKTYFYKLHAPKNHPMPGVELRPATMEDLDTVRKGYISLVKYLRRHNIKIWYAGYPMNMLEQDIKNKELFVLARGKTIVGAVALTKSFQHNEHFTWQTPEPAIHINRFGIFPEFMKKKISIKFLELIEKYAKEKGKKSIRLMIDHGHAAAIKLNESFGLKSTGGEYIPPLYPERIKRGYEKDISPAPTIDSNTNV